MSYHLAQVLNGRPVLWTDRLRLRALESGDLPAATLFWSTERAHLMGGPWLADEVRASFRDVEDQWQRLGFGLFAVTLAGSDTAIGTIGPFFPETHPEPELGWTLWSAEHEGRGLAYEAATAARDWFFAATGYASAVSHTHPGNLRSHRLCARLGARPDPQARHPYPDAGTLSFRHHRPVAA